MKNNRTGGGGWLVLAVTLFVFALWPATKPSPEPSKLYDGPVDTVVNGPVHAGKRVQIDLPLSEHVQNIGAPAPPHSGLCVFATMDMQARWHAREKLIGIINKINEGGGWPEKVDQVLKHFDPDLKHLQYEGTDPTILDKALSRRIAVGVTFGWSERYKGPDGKILPFIYHMALLVYLDQERACVLDDNFPGTYEWMSRAEFLRRWVHPTGKGWGVIFLEPPPPPFASNEDAIASTYGFSLTVLPVQPWQPVRGAIVRTPSGVFGRGVRVEPKSVVSECGRLPRWGLLPAGIPFLPGIPIPFGRRDQPLWTAKLSGLRNRRTRRAGRDLWMA